MVVHIYNPSYLGSEGRRICSSRPAQTKVGKDPISKGKIQFQKERSHFKTQNTNKRAEGHSSSGTELLRMPESSISNNTHTVRCCVTGFDFLFSVGSTTGMRRMS
jgi:hypothetical protein